MKAFRVSFEPGARTAWHTHPLGQALHVLSGVGLVQLQGQPAQVIRPGDTVWIEPDEVHWHGAAPGHTMVHLAMQVADANGVDVNWLAHVSNEEYAAAA
jgi:quercetin dioxygenase-like cupin family protein